MQYKLTSYNPEKSYSGFYFFILNKGLNSGKPLRIPCPNCVVCQVENEEDLEQFFWLLFGMWQGKLFRQHLIGSVIPFIRKRDLIEVIDLGAQKFKNDPEKVVKNITSIMKIEENLISITKRAELLGQLKRTLIYELFNL